MRTILILLFALLLVSCSSVPFLTPYKMDIHQGNFVTADMREKLKLGMTRQQVRYVLGTPLVSDAFHGDRWDYVYNLEHGRKVVDRQGLAIYFEGDKLVRIDDDPKPVDPVPVTAVAPVVAESVAVPPVAEVPQAKPVIKADPSAEVWHAVQDWAAAWSEQDVQGYLAFYAPGFKPDGMSRADWEKQRSERIGKAKVTKVEVNDLAVSVPDDSHATATFTQTYRSDRHRDVMRKTLRLEKVSGAWLIVSEQAAK